MFGKIQSYIERIKFSRADKPALSRGRIILYTSISVVLLMIVVVGVTIWSMRAIGKSSLYNKGTTAELPWYDLFGEGERVWQDNWITVDGQTYAYNQDILTFLLMGIDQMEKVEEADNFISGGQSDAMFLVVCNPTKKQIDIIAINRNTMVDVDRYNLAGNYRDTVIAPISLQYAYGDGMVLSCEYAVAAVSKLFLYVPIHGYASLNMGGVELINDAIGGVEVVVREDLDLPSGTVQAGESVLLEGADALWYVQNRDIYTIGSADQRLERQKQYINALMRKMLEQLKASPKVALDFYELVKEYVITDLTLSEMTYMASTVAFYDFSTERIHSIEGENVREGDYTRFYHDIDALYELILEVFYDKVE